MNKVEYVVSQSIKFLEKLKLEISEKFPKDEIEHKIKEETVVIPNPETKENTSHIVIPQNKWINIPINTGELTLLSVSLDITIPSVSDIVVGTADKEVSSYNQLATATRFNSQAVVDNYNGITNKYTDGSVPYGDKVYSLVINIDLDTQMYQSFINGVKVSEPVRLRNEAREIRFICIRGIDIEVTTSNSKFKAGTPIVLESTSTPKKEETTNGLRSEFFTIKNATQKEFKHPFWNERAYLNQNNQGRIRKGANKHYMTNVAKLNQQMLKIDTSANYTVGLNGSGGMGYAMENMTWTAQGAYTVIRNALVDNDRSNLDLVAEICYRVLVAGSRSKGHATRLFVCWAIPHIARSLELLIHEFNYDFSKNKSIAWNNIQDITNTNKVFFDTYSNNKDWYFLGANWETSTILAFKMMAIVVDDREMYHHHDKILAMLIKSYIFLPKDGRPIHPMDIIGFEESLDQYMGRNLLGGNNATTLGNEYYWDENVKASTISKTDCLFGSKVGRAGGWKLGKDPSLYNVPVGMEFFRDGTHDYMGIDPLAMIVKLMVLQGETVSKDWLDRVILSSTTSASVAMGQTIKIFGDTRDKRHCDRIRLNTNYAYGHIAYELAREFGYDTKYMKLKHERDINRWLAHTADMSHCGVASEAYLGVRA